LSDLDAADAEPAGPSVFLSYASEDREAARLLRDALPKFGLEVWYDESELGGGEAWDQKIRRQIRECDYFMPLISAQTEARHEGYFRREWRLAVERTLDIADDHAFLLPVVIDATEQSKARVPEKFLTVQWLKVPGGKPTPGLESMCRRLAAGNTAQPKPGRKAARKNSKAATIPKQMPQFPRQEPGQKMKFWVEVIGWFFHSLWTLFNRLPAWVRVLLYIWLFVALLSRVDTSKHQDSDEISPAKVEKLKAIAENSQSPGLNKSDIVKLGTQIAKQFTDEADDPTDNAPLLAIPFTAPSGDAAAAKFADATFAMAYGRLSMSRKGEVGLSADPLPSHELGAALERARANHSTYVLTGTVDGVAGAKALTVKIATVADGSLLWSKTYPILGADSAAIAAEVDAKIPSLASK
jgi:hypothetical protein